MAMLEVTPRDVVKKVSMAIIEDAASQLEKVYQKLSSVVGSKIESSRAGHQLSVKRALCDTSYEFHNSVDKPNSRLMRIVRKAANARARKAFMKLICGGLTQSVLLSSLVKIKVQGLLQSSWIDMMLTTMEANVQKKLAKFPYVTTADANGAILLITAGISTFVLCVFDLWRECVCVCVCVRGVGREMFCVHVDLRSDTSTMEYACAQLGVSHPENGIWVPQPAVFKKLMKGISQGDKAMIRAELALTVNAYAFLPSRVGTQPHKHDMHLDHGTHKYSLLEGSEDLSSDDLGDLVDELYDTAYVVATVPFAKTKLRVLRTDFAAVIADGHWCEYQITHTHPTYPTVAIRLNVRTDGMLMHDLYLSTLLGKEGGPATNSCPPITFRKHSKEQGR
jgi:hypothetical protein